MYRCCPKCFRSKCVLVGTDAYFNTGAKNGGRYGVIPRRFAFYVAASIDFKGAQHVNRIKVRSPWLLTFGASALFKDRPAYVNETIGDYFEVKASLIDLIDEGHFDDPNNIVDLGDFLIGHVLGNKFDARVIDRVCAQTEAGLIYFFLSWRHTLPLYVISKCLGAINNISYRVLGKNSRNLTIEDCITGVRGDNFYYPALLNYFVITGKISIDRALELFASAHICPRCCPEKYFAGKEITPRLGSIILEDLV